MQVVTVTRFRQLQNTYYVSADVGLRGRRYQQQCYGAGDAAATAVEYAMRFDKYVIIGDDDVMKLIPQEVRSKK